MRIWTVTICFIALTLCQAATIARAQFAGRWQTQMAPAIGKPMFTIDIVGDGNRISGNFVHNYPNGTQQVMAMLDPVVDGNSLNFQTQDREAMFNWRLELKRKTRRAILHGTEASPPLGQRPSELIIDMPVRNYGQAKSRLF